MSQTNSNSITIRARPVVRCLITSSILLFLLLSIGSLMAWLLLHPRVPSFRVNSLTVSNVTFLDTKLVADYELKFVAQNPNWKINIQFYTLDVSIRYQNCECSRISIKSFLIRKRDQVEKAIELESNASNVAIGRKQVVELEKDLRRKEVVFDVKMNGLVMYRGGKWFSKVISMEVWCEDLMVMFSGKGDAGKLTDIVVDCRSYFT